VAPKVLVCPFKRVPRDADRLSIEREREQVAIDH